MIVYYMNTFKNYFYNFFQIKKGEETKMDKKKIVLIIAAIVVAAALVITGIVLALIGDF